MTTKTPYTRLWERLRDEIGADRADGLRQEFNRWQYEYQSQLAEKRQQEEKPLLNEADQEVLRAFLSGEQKQLTPEVFAACWKAGEEMARREGAVIDRSSPDVAAFLDECGL